MTPARTAILALVLGTLATAGHADQVRGKGAKHAPGAHAIAPVRANCPPGLAKKNPPCVPPGLAKQRYRVGERIDGPYSILRYPDRYGLDPHGTYYRIGDHLYRVDRETRKVLDFIGAAAALLN
ncbi:excinuclease ABC subunit A [Aquicoccus porphyridii]|uniref:excinuclease ABC subunit A n=1 Tax=Aquicoccus porphyridii TaxID=1852029 RepID=UPI001FE5644A|nr:excinuclease ABC subunit A [Aquicoccus porphyridii]